MDKKFPYGYDVNAYIDKAFYMKRLFFALMMLCAGMSVQAQTIHVDHHFWDGYSLYTVKEIRMGKYFYMTTSQGNELTLEKVDGNQC